MLDENGNPIKGQDEELDENGNPKPKVETKVEKKELDPETAKTIADLQKKIADLSDNVNPNWKAARTTIANMKKALEAKGIKVDDTGTPITETKYDPEEVRRESRGEARKEILDIHYKRTISKFDEEQKKVIDKFYKKLTTGEEITGENIDSFIQQAITLAVPNKSTHPIIESIQDFGNGPRPKNNQEKGFGETEVGKNVATEMGLNFHEASKK